MKFFRMLIALFLCLTIATLFIAGCGEKKTEQQVEEEVQQVQEEAPVDTAAAVEDTTVMETPEE